MVHKQTAGRRLDARRIILIACLLALAEAGAIGPAVWAKERAKPDARRGEPTTGKVLKSDVEYDQQRTRLDKLERVYAEKDQAARSARAKLRELAEQVGSSDRETLALKEKIAIQQFADTRRELTRSQTQLRQARSQRDMQKALLASPAGTAVGEADIDAMAQRDPITVQVLVPILAELKKKAVELELQGAASNADTKEKLTRITKSIQGELDGRRAELRETLHQKNRAALEGEVKRIEIHLAVLERAVDEIQRDVESQRKQAEQTGKRIVEIEMQRAEVRQLDEVLESIAQEREKLRVEMRSATG